MKPIKLIMNGFMTYKEKNEIDFTKLYSSRVFLISGDTGSGKTSIFDAISFALFGEISRSNDISILRCDFLGPEDPPTYVNFVFEVDGKVYEIERKPSQFAKKSKKAGVHIQHEAVLYQIKEEEKILLADKPTQANKEIKKIIGLDLSQLKKVMLLAQGKFSEFLTAKSDEKAKLLSDIFSTGQYKDVQEKLKEKSSDASKQIQVIDKELENLIENNGLIKDKITINYILGRDFAKIGQIIDDTSETLSKESEDLKEKTEDLNKKINQDLQSLTMARSENENIRAYVKLKEEKKSLDEKLEGFESLKKKLKRSKDAYAIKAYRDNFLELERKEKELENEISAKKSELDSLEKNLQVLEDEKEKVPQEREEIKNLNIELAGLEEREEKIENFLAIEKDYKILKKSIEENEIKLKKLDEIRREREEISGKIIKLSASRLDLVEKKSQIEKDSLNKDMEIQELKQLLEKSLKNEENKDTLESLKIDLDLIQERIEEIEDEYSLGKKYQEQIEINKYKKILNESGVCPVCGSIHQEKIPLEEVIDLDMEKISDKLQKFQIEEASLKKDIGSLGKEIREDLEESLSLREKIEGLEAQKKKFIEDLRDVAEILKTTEEKEIENKEKKKDLDVEENRLQKSLNEISKQKEDFQEISGKYLGLKDQFAGLDPDLIKNKTENLKENIKDLEAKIKKIEDDYYKLSNKISATKSSLASAKTSKEKLGLELVQKEKDLQEKIEEKFINKEEFLDFLDIYQDLIGEEKNIEGFFEIYKENAIRLKEKETYKDKDYIDTKSLEDSLKENEKTLKTLRENLKQIDFKLMGLEKTSKELKKIQENFKEVKKDADNLKRLADIANGNFAKVEGREKLDFETFVLIYYFEKVLSFANKRLYKMSNGQFTMLRKNRSGDLRSKSGLDIDILDANTGKKRPVVTLSGGETFLASLALALGLSDEISQENGGIKIDTLFIDEGFGTLSDEYLQNAISTIEDLSYEDKFIGLISHVKELKDAIDAKILVTYDKSKGSKVEVSL
jgi:exonuclease SbcC